jgi:hypothetical protein
MPEYDEGPAGDVRRAVASGAFPIVNDPAKVAATIIEVAEADPAPLRVPLGDDTFRDVRDSYVARLAEHDGYEGLAKSVVEDDASSAAGASR